MILKFLDFLKKEPKKLLPSGNYFFYTRNGFGVEISPENKIHWLRNFALKANRIKNEQR